MGNAKTNTHHCTEHEQEVYMDELPKPRKVLKDTWILVGTTIGQTKQILSSPRIIA